MSENKVQFGLKNVYYAVLTETVTSGVTTQSWATPVAIKGAVSLSLDPQGGVTPFYADNMVYYNAIANNGYSGDLEIARIPDSMMTDIWGVTSGTTSKVLTEKSNVEPKNFALLYQIDGDSDEELYVMYKCNATRPKVSSSTVQDSKTPSSQTCSVTCVPLENGSVMARTTANTPSATKSSWFTSVFVESGQ